MKKKIRKIILVILFILIAFIIYLIVGGILPFLKHPKVSQDTKNRLIKSKFYGREIGPDRATVIEDNEEALKMRLKLIADAKEKVVLSTFDFRSDNAGKDMLAALFYAAERGVKVEIFADGFNSVIQMEGNNYFYALSSHPNVKIIIYNQINILKPWNGLGRMHDKYVIADDFAYILGGRNTFGYFLGNYEGHKNYDRDVLVYNTKITKNIPDENKSEVKDSDLNNETGKTASSIYQIQEYYKNITSLEYCRLFHDKESLAEKKGVRSAREELKKRYESLLDKYKGFLDKPYDYAANTYETNKINLLSNPIGRYAKEPVVYYGLMQLAQNANEEVKLHTPYIICDDEMYQGLERCGDKVTIMTNSAENNGNLFGTIDYLKHKADILDTGVKIKEYEGGISYHGKSMTVDDDIAVVGSFNLDMRSAYIDTELMLVINSKDVCSQLKSSMEQYEQKAATVKSETEYSYIPEGMTMKPLSKKKKRIKTFLGPVMNWFRFLF